ncbi:MAG: phage terminase large subunit family protein [Rhodospirillales bacterium]|nr:phage terminase large subunit family protein [Rhodospirillales bacterium]
MDAPIDDDIEAGVAWPAGYVHVPLGIDAERIKQLVAEQLVSVKTRRGFERLDWQKLRERNETPDCRVYARAAGWLAGIDRFGDRLWRTLESRTAAADQPPRSPAPSGILRRHTRVAVASTWMTDWWPAPLN